MLGMREQGAATMPRDDSSVMLTASAIRRSSQASRRVLPNVLGRVPRTRDAKRASFLPRPRGHLPRIHPIEELRPAVARPRPRVLAQHALVDGRRPARRVSQPDVAVADHRRARNERPFHGTSSMSISMMRTFGSTAQRCKECRSARWL